MAARSSGSATTPSATTSSRARSGSCSGRSMRRARSASAWTRGGGRGGPRTGGAASGSCSYPRGTTASGTTPRRGASPSWRGRARSPSRSRPADGSCTRGPTSCTGPSWARPGLAGGSRRRRGAPPRLARDGAPAAWREGACGTRAPHRSLWLPGAGVRPARCFSIAPPRPSGGGAMKIVVFGLTVSSSWGNGHATLWRALARALARRGHRLVFFERDVPYYAAHRDLVELPGGELRFYRAWEDVLGAARRHIADADVAMVTSYCPDGIAAAELILSIAPGRRVFYDLDTPVTLDALRRGEPVAYIGAGGLGDFDMVLSYTGGAALDELRTRLGARRVAPLYGSVDPDVHRPVPADPRYAADLSYLGSYAQDRQDALRELFRSEPVAYIGVGGLGDFDMVLSYSGGAALGELRTRLGARRVAPLYGSVDPDVHRPVPADPRYAADLSYLGTYAQDRQDALRELF